MFRISSFSSIYNSTLEYVKEADAVIHEYGAYIAKNMNCISCLRDIVNYLDSVKNDIISERTEDIIHFINEKQENWKKVFYASEVDQKTNILPKWPIIVHLVTAIFCLSCSCIYHLFNAYDQKVNELLNKLDFGGIAILIVGSCYPPNYYVFYCHFSKIFSFLEYALFYMTFMSVFGVIVFICSMQNWFLQKEYHKFKIGLFLIFGISAGLPAFHLSFYPESVYGGEEQFNFIHWVLGGASYILGALIYMSKFPEKIWPGKFCIVGNSHQIFHIGALMGVLFHHIGSIEVYNYRSSLICLGN